MAFAEAVFTLKKITSLPSKCVFGPPRSLVAIKHSVRSAHTSNGAQTIRRTDSMKLHRSTVLFEFKQQIANETNSCNARRWYSDEGTDKPSSKREGDDNDASNDNREKLPSLADNIVMVPSFFTAFAKLFELVRIRNNPWRMMLQAKQALQIISHKLAAADFDYLEEYVDANELERVKGIVEKMTVAERRELAVSKADIKSVVMYDIVFSKERRRKSEREFMEILVHFLVRRKNNGDEWFVNLGFKNEIKKGSEDDLMINLIRFKKQ